MPEIQVHHRESVFAIRKDERSFGNSDTDPRYILRDEFYVLLRKTCVELFAITELPLTPHDFSIYSSYADTGQTQSIIIRIMLHRFQERLDNADTHAQKLANTLSSLLNDERMVEWRGQVTVGVSLVFAEIAWKTA